MKNKETKYVLKTNGLELDKVTINGKEYDVNDIIYLKDKPENFTYK